MISGRPSNPFSLRVALPVIVGFLLAVSPLWAELTNIDTIKELETRITKCLSKECKFHSWRRSNLVIMTFPAIYTYICKKCGMSSHDKKNFCNISHSMDRTVKEQESFIEKLRKCGILYS